MFSKEYDALIFQFIDLSKGQTDEAITGYVLFHASQDIPGEVHTQNEVLERVKVLRSRSGQRQGPGTGTGPGPGQPPGQSGTPRTPLPDVIEFVPLGTHRDIFGRSIATGENATFTRWKQSWNQLINTASTTAQSMFGAARSSVGAGATSFAAQFRNTASAVGSMAQSAMSGVGSVARNFVSGISGFASSFRPRTPRRRSRPYPRMTRAPSRGGGIVWPSVGPHLRAMTGHIARSAIGGQFVNLMPQPRGFFGQAGGVAGTGLGASIGASFGRTIGKAGGVVGQAAGTVIGNFVDKMKDAVTQAHAFAVALKESNQRFIYYNSSIMMSYVESDLASMIRDMRIARAIAPSTVSLNRAITNYQAVNTPRDIFLSNIANEWAQIKMVPGQILSESMQPFWRGVEMMRQYVSPQGNTGATWTGSVLRTLRNSIYGSIGAFAGLGPFSALFGMPWFRDAIDKFLNPDKDITGPLSKGAWDTLFGTPGKFFVEPGTTPGVPPDGVMTRRIRNRLDRF